MVRSLRRGNARGSRLAGFLAVGVLAVAFVLPSVSLGSSLPSGCRLVTSFLPGTPNLTARFPNPGVTPDSDWNVTNGEVLAAFDEVCESPTFELLAGSQASSNFSLQFGGNTRTHQVTFDFTFAWVGRGGLCDGSPPCEIQEYWSAWPQNGTVSGPTVSTGPLVCAGCPAVPVTPSWLDQYGGALSVAIVGGAATALIVAGLVVQRRRGRWPPREGAAGSVPAPGPGGPSGDPSAPARTARP